MTSAALHWHGYGPWTGPHDAFKRENESLRRPGFDPNAAAPPILTDLDAQRRKQTDDFVRADTPPLQLGHYLYRRSGTRRELTWSSPDAPMRWLADRYVEYPPGPHLNYEPLDAKIGFTGEGLRGGSDAYWQWALSASQVFAIAVICCPHRHVRTPCPLPPT